MINAIVWIVIGIVMFLYLFACCKVCSDADDWMDEKFNEENKNKKDDTHY